MSPCMAGKSPALRLHGICDLFRFCPLCIQIKIRMRVKPRLFIIIQIIWSCLIADICAVTQDSIVACKRYNSLMSMICKIRMFLHKPVDQRYNIIVTYNCASIILYIFVANLPLFVYNKLGGNSISILGVIITYIVLRKNKRCFSLRKINLLCLHFPIFINVCQIIKVYHYISLVIHDLGYLIKLIHSGHNLIITICLVISIKRLGSIHDQGMVKNVSYLFWRPGYTFILFLLEFLCSILKMDISHICIVLLQKADCTVIIILGCFLLSCGQYFLLVTDLPPDDTCAGSCCLWHNPI